MIVVDNIIDGKVNYFALVIGPPGHGKSSLCAELAEDRLRAGRWVLVQDTNREFGRLCASYATPDAFLAALRAAGDGGQPLPAGAALPCLSGADELLELGIRLGREWNQERGHVTEPLCIVINEASGFEESGPTYLGKVQNLLLNQRRHLGLELVYCLQRPTMLPRPVYDVATDVYLFFQASSARTRELEGLLGLERGELDVLLTLPPHRYLHWTPRRGDGRGGLH